MAALGAALVLVVLSTCSWCLQAEPLKADFTRCVKLKLASALADPTGNRYLDCCTLDALMRHPQPAFKTWRQYLKENPLPTKPRVRPAAHMVAEDKAYLEQLDRAYQLMKALPESDPRSLLQQSHFHCVYGSVGVTRQMDHRDLNYVIHMNYLIFPWHRWYTFFHERILAKLVGNDSLVLPFWNWDHQSPSGGYHHLPNVMPEYYRDPTNYPGLYHPNRDEIHAPGKAAQIIDLIKSSVMSKNRRERDPDEARALNNAHLRSIIVDSTANGEREPFLSYPVRGGEQIPNLFNWEEADITFEGLAHTAVHFWVGDRNRQHADMGVSALAVFDPIFFTHHANVDRLWNVWQGLEGRSNFDDPDWLDAAFFFYNEHGEIVKVTVADCLDSNMLGYSYQEVDNPWISFDISASPHLANYSLADVMGWKQPLSHQASR